MKKEVTANTTLSHYKIVSKIGAGGMGEVYLAEDTKLDRKVAIKFLHHELSKDADKLNRFIREAKSVSALNHPNILTIHEIGEHDGTNYIVTELIDGKTLRDQLSQNEELPLNQVLKIGVQVAEALAAAHQAGIVHRDIKPENIMLRKDGYAKVLDFGLAKLSEERRGDAETQRRGEEDNTLIAASPRLPVPVSPNTEPGMVMGTVSYMSPEQARGNPTDARTDIFSLGVVLYEMLAGKLPFSGETANHTIVAILEKEPLQLENVPVELQRIVRKSLTKDVEMRYQSARDLLIDLKTLRRELDIQGELERSVVPNRETANSVPENATQMLSGIGESTVSGQNAATQNVTTSSSSLEYAVTQAKSHKIATAVAAVLLVAVIAAVGYFGFLSKGRNSKQIESIAVMPFVNESGNADVEYLSDGMTETLIGNLTQLPNLNVKARSSVFRYKGKETDAKTLGKELNVQAILNGRVSQRGDQLILSLELVDVATENAIWSQRYDRKQSDLVALQSEIARDVSSKLKSRLSGAEVASVEKNYTSNAEAYQLYLQGRYQWNKRNPDAFEKAVVFFKQAIEKDPNYALAYSGLADTYSLFPAYGNSRPKDYMPQAKAAALRALELDPNLAEAHASLGEVIFYYEYDWAGAGKAFKRAIELDPKYPTAHQWYAELLEGAGRHDEAIREISKAVELDPFSNIINQQMVQLLTVAKRFDEALMQNKKVNELFPEEIGFHYTNATIYEAQGKYAEALEEYILAAKAAKAKPEEIQEAKDIYESVGWDGIVKKREEERLKSLNDQQAKDKNAYVQAINFANSYAYLKDKEKTIEYLNKAYDERSMSVLYLKVSFNWDFLRDDPRFKELVKRVGIPE